MPLMSRELNTVHTHAYCLIPFDFMNDFPVCCVRRLKTGTGQNPTDSHLPYSSSLTITCTLFVKTLLYNGGKSKKNWAAKRRFDYFQFIFRAIKSLSSLARFLPFQFLRCVLLEKTPTHNKLEVNFSNHLRWHRNASEKKKLKWKGF